MHHALFHRLAQGVLTSEELPTEIDLGELSDLMSELWRRSIEKMDEGQITEWGAILAVEAEGKPVFVNVTCGDEAGVLLSKRVPQGLTFIGTFHTHPYEDGTTGMAFTAVDLVGAINSDERFSLVLSGDEAFAVVRTDRTSNRVDRLTVSAHFNTLYRYYVLEKRVPRQEALLVTNLELCEQLGLAFYYGRIPNALKEVFRP